MEELKNAIEAAGFTACRFSFLLLSDRPPTTAKKSLLTAFCFSRVFLQGRERETAAERENQSERRQRQRENTTQHAARLIFSALLGIFSARWYSRQGGTAQSEYKRFLTASRLTACKLGTAHEIGTPSEARQHPRPEAIPEIKKSPDAPMCKENVGEL